MSRKGSVDDLLSLNEEQIKERSFTKNQLFDALLKLRKKKSTSKDEDICVNDSKGISALLNEMNHKLDRLIAENSSHREEIEELKTTIKIQSSIIERHEREFRKRNVIIRGMEERLSARACLELVLSEISVPFGVDDAVESVYRVGRRSERGHRPIKVVFRDFSQKLALLKASKELKNSDDLKNVFINNDLTPVQQERERLLRKRRDEERAKPQNSGKSVRIFRGALYVGDEKIAYIDEYNENFQ